jgi:hypothetical protein
MGVRIGMLKAYAFASDLGCMRSGLGERQRRGEWAVIPTIDRCVVDDTSRQTPLFALLSTQLR